MSVDWLLGAAGQITAAPVGRCQRTVGTYLFGGVTNGGGLKTYSDAQHTRVLRAMHENRSAAWSSLVGVAYEMLCLTPSALPEGALRNAPAALEPEPREQHHGTQ